MDIQTATLVILILCVVGMAGIVVVLILLVRKLEWLINLRREGAKQMTDLKLFDQLPKDYKDAVNNIVENVLGDERPDMNDAFRVVQAEIFLGSALPEDLKPDLKMLEIEALSFRDGWEKRGQSSGVPS